jgi:SNF2 family DNA or RNA helicase
MHAEGGEDDEVRHVTCTSLIAGTLKKFSKDEITCEKASEVIGNALGVKTGEITMKPHQLRGLRAIMRHVVSHKGPGILAHEMGLGKSLQALVFASMVIQMSREKNEGARILIVVPTSMITVWVDYWRAYMKPMSDVHVLTIRERAACSTILGNPDASIPDGKDREGRRKIHLIVIASHQSVDRAVCNELDEADWVKPHLRSKLKSSQLSRAMFLSVFRKGGVVSGRHEWEPFHVRSWARSAFMCPACFDLMIVDEVHVAKNSKTSMFASLCLVRSELKLGLTGTPLVNSITDVAALAHLTQVASEWRKLSREEYWMHHELTRPPGIYTWMNVEKKEGKNLEAFPTARIVKYRVGLTRKELDVYDALLEDGGAESSSDFAQLMSILGKLRRVASLGRLGGKKYEAAIPEGMEGRKMQRVLAWVTNVLQEDADSHIALFSEWTSCLDELESRLRGKGVSTCRLDGSMNTKERAKSVKSFQEGETRVILVTHGAGGTGLNLTAGTHVVLFEPYWNYARMNQAVARVVRMGCRAKEVQVLFVVAKSTIDEIILDKVAESKLRQEKFHIDGEGEQTERYRLNIEELRAMIALAKVQKQQRRLLLLEQN